jgi:hypothetical protein
MNDAATEYEVVGDAKIFRYSELLQLNRRISKSQDSNNRKARRNLCLH